MIRANQATRAVSRALRLLLVPPLVCAALPADAQTLVLEVEGAQEGDRLGSDVDRLGDVDGDGRADFAIVALDGELLVPDAGLVTIRSGADLGVLRQLEGEASLDDFGACVVDAGDVDGDGHDDVLVGATKHDGGGVDAGAVYLFSGADGALLLKVVGDADGDLLGGVVVGLGDVDGDGVPDFAAGAVHSDAAGQQAGMVRVYSGADGAALHTWYGGAPQDFLGCALAALGDLDGDGLPELAMGAWGEDSGGDRAGAVYVRSTADGSILYTLHGWVPVGLFGLELCNAGDVDGDGRSELAVGSPTEDAVTSDSGAVRLFSGVNGRLLHTWLGQTVFERLGSSLDGGLDVDGDGRPDLAIGAAEPNAGAGKVLVYSARDARLLFQVEGEQPDDVFGADVALLPDLDGDGRADLLVGAPDADPNGSKSGAAYLYVSCAGPTVYCEAKPSSLGCLPAIGYEGSPSLSGPDDFLVTAGSIVSGRNGLAFFGFAPSDHPFAGGTLCVLPPLHRTPVQNAGGSAPGSACDGAFALPFSQELMTREGIQVGQRVYVQFWYRDPAHPDGTGVGMTDGLEFQVCP